MSLVILLCKGFSILTNLWLLIWQISCYDEKSIHTCMYACTFMCIHEQTEYSCKISCSFTQNMCMLELKKLRCYCDKYLWNKCPCLLRTRILLDYDFYTCPGTWFLHFWLITGLNRSVQYDWVNMYKIILVMRASCKSELKLHILISRFQRKWKYSKTFLIRTLTVS